MAEKIFFILFACLFFFAGAWWLTDAMIGSAPQAPSKRQSFVEVDAPRPPRANIKTFGRTLGVAAVHKALGECGDPCRVTRNNGGVVKNFEDAASAILAGAKSRLIIDGPCYSACAILADKVRYYAPRKVCITPRATFHFHKAWALSLLTVYNGQQTVETFFDPPHSKEINDWVAARKGYPRRGSLKMSNAQARKFWRPCETAPLPRPRLRAGSKTPRTCSPTQPAEPKARRLSFSFIFRIVGGAAQKSMEYHISTDEEKKITATLEGRQDTDALRITRSLAMPDLSRAEGSPIADLVSNIRSVPDFKNFDTVTVPEIVPTDIAFDLFDFAPDHPARSRSDTYFADDTHILRPHTTAMWYYYLTLPEIKERLARGEDIGVFCFWEIYCQDEIDRTHMNVFHQIDALYLTRKDKKIIGLEDLQAVEASVVQSVFGKNIEYRFHEETFPYTHPSTEIEIKKGDDWIEILGSGVVKGSVLQKLGVDPAVYNGWAFGFGLERWAIISMELPDIRLLWSRDPRVTSQLRLGQKYKEVSKYPPVVRDISFVVRKDFAPNNYFDLIREVVGEGLIEEVVLLDTYSDEQKFGEGRASYTYRIVYRSLERTLTSEEVDKLHRTLEEATKTQYGARVR